MKKSSFFKLIWALPVLSFALTSCNDKEEPFIDGEILCYAVQVEDPASHGNFKYIPDLRAATVSNSDVVTWAFYKGNAVAGNEYAPPAFAGAGFDSPFRDAYESRMGDGAFRTSLTAINGKYTFRATNADMKSVEVWYEWNFKASSPFTEGWGENSDPGGRNEALHYEYFNYNGTYVNASVIPFRNEGVNLTYRLMYTNYNQIGPASNTDPVDGPIEEPDAFVLSRMSGYFSDPVVASGDRESNINLTLRLPKEQNHGARVALVVLKTVEGGAGDPDYLGTVMLRSEYKTIHRDKPAFLEAEVPPEVIP